MHLNSSPLYILKEQDIKAAVAAHFQHKIMTFQGFAKLHVLYQLWSTKMASFEPDVIGNCSLVPILEFTCLLMLFWMVLVIRIRHQWDFRVK